MAFTNNSILQTLHLPPPQRRMQKNFQGVSSGLKITKQRVWGAQPPRCCRVYLFILRQLLLPFLVFCNTIYLTAKTVFMLGISILLCGYHDWSTQSCEQQGDKQCYLHKYNTNKIINRHSEPAECRQVLQFSNLLGNACREWPQGYFGSFQLNFSC